MAHWFDAERAGQDDRHFHDARRGAYPELPSLAIDNDNHVYRDDIPVVYAHCWRTGTLAHGLDWTDRTARIDFSAVKGGALTSTGAAESTIRVENHLQVPAG